MVQPLRTEEVRKRGEEKRKALKKALSMNLDTVSKQTIRAFLEVWAYLDGFKNTKEPMSYDMVYEIFGSIDRDKVQEVFKHAMWR